MFKMTKKRTAIKNWEKENERLEKKMYRLYGASFAKRRKAILNLVKDNKIKFATL